MDERSQRIAQRFEVPMVIAALLVIPGIVIQGDGSVRCLRAAKRQILDHYLSST
jgi:hypothetical protein